MNIVYVLFPLATLISFSFLVGLLLSIRSGQFEDIEAEATKILFSPGNMTSNQRERLDS